MKSIDLWKLGAVVLVTAIAIGGLVPSCQYYSQYYNQPAEKLASVPVEKISRLRQWAIHLGLDLQGGMHLVLEVDRTGLTPTQVRDAVDRAMEILRQRIDQFGVAEPLIQRQGEDRIVIQLPGLTDRQRALDLIGKTALLEFKLVRTAEETKAVFDRVDAYLAGMGVAAADTAFRNAPLSAHFLSLDTDAFVPAGEDLRAVERLLATAGLDSIIPRDSQILWGDPSRTEQRGKGRALYVVKRDAEMTGGSVADAHAQLGLETMNPGAWGVSLTLTPRGRGDFSRITGNNINRQLAIVLDGVVSSAPVIRSKIPDGTASITGGSFTAQTSRDLSIVLQAGALPAPVHVIEERSVGPSLGNDSIREGILAGLIGTVMVVVFMLVYYQLSGLVAIAALLLNILYLFAGMVLVPLVFGQDAGTLTLPGIAGVVLTIGMAVDANVLIFERIREELRNQKSVRQSVELGYDRAFRTILDSNLTTLISALFLFWFGTGPIKGFAVTLSIGLIANMFTAVFFTRMIFDFILSRGKVERLSI